MSKQFSPNLTPANGTIAMFNFYTFLIAQGWVKIRDSDGTTFSSSGTRVTGSGSGANGFGNVSAWVELRAPDSSVFICIQRGSNTTYRVKFASTAFSGGTPGATQVGSSTTEIIWLGAGTDAAPTYNTAYTTDNTYHQHLCADNAAPYGFYQFCLANTTGTEVAGSAIFDPLVGCPSVVDTRQWVLWGAATAWNAIFSSSYSVSNEANSQVRGWLGFGSTPSVVGLAAGSINSANGAVSSGAGGFNSNTGLEDTLAIPIIRHGSLALPVGWKGVSTMVQWSMSTIRSSGSTLNTGGVIDHASIGSGGFIVDYPNTALVL